MSKGVNKKLLAIGALMMVAMAAMAMVYYSAYDVSTVTATQMLSVTVSANDPDVYAPYIWANEDAGSITVTIKDVGSPANPKTVKYRLIIDCQMLKETNEGLGKIRSIAIAVYKDDGDGKYDGGDELLGFLTPWTPTLAKEISHTSEDVDSKDDTNKFWLRLNGVAYTAGNGAVGSTSTIDIGIRASVELISVSS